MCSGGIHDSGNRPIINNSRMCRASARSLLARFLFPRLAAVSAGSARCTIAPTRRSSSATNRQPVVASNADLELLTTEPLTEPPHASPMRRRDPRAHHLTGLGVQPLRSDLRSVLIKPHHDRHLQRLLTPDCVAETTHRPEEAYRQTRTAQHMPSIKSRPGILGRRRATQRDQVRPTVDSQGESQPAADPNSNDPAGQHRINNNLSLS